MDNTKDNQNMGQQTSPVAFPNKNPEPISFFEKDEIFVFAYKKTEKLATALYMVTNLFTDNEPMKWTLRKKVGGLLSFMIGYKDISLSDQKDFIHSIQTQVLEIVSLLEISSRSGLVSHMNFSILKTEFSSLIATLDSASEKHTINKEYQALPEAIFDVPRGSHFSDKHSFSDGKNTQYESKNDPSSIPVHDVHVFKKNNRQNLIMNALKKKNDLTIKDIAQTVRDCSEKTIQRELISLISLGLVKKTGERRWSRYSLI